MRFPIRLKSLEEETKTTFTPKKAKKDYESLTPFKFFCQLCSFKTKRESHYKSHMSIHEKNPDCSFYGCDHCSFVTLRLGHLRRHEAKHSAVQYQCQKCKYSTDSEKLLHRHMRQKHSSADKRQKMTFSCPKCTYTTKTQPLLIRHLNVHLNPRVDMEPELIQSYRCEHCDYVTIKKEHFCRHMLCHSEKRPYLCDLCGAAFKRQDTLRQHKVSHLDREVRNYQHVCPHCEKTFRSTAHLADHMTIHTHIRAYLCEICGAAFKTKSVQRNHVNTIHKNPRSHVCTHCGKRFNTKFALQRHVRSHDSDTNEIMTDTFAVNDLTEDETVTKQALSATNDESESSSNATAINNQAQIMLVTPDSTSYETGHSSQLIPHAFIHSSETNTALLYLLN
ncbi:zinc finger protein 711-like [Tubulanus polymorphus]|uniref:zinc finger protein 711-like n=1 Tax=Tubulanus polymorphus TaxID=672921 RepID=UPI003DA25748